eukprot:2083831-Rhodomonas_salina.1
MSDTDLGQSTPYGTATCPVLTQLPEAAAVRYCRQILTGSGLRDFRYSHLVCVWIVLRGRYVMSGIGYAHACMRVSQACMRVSHSRIPSDARNA